MYCLEIKPDLDKLLHKLKKKSPRQFQIIFKKVGQILKNPLHFKPLKGDLHGSRRVHIDKSFVLIYEFNQEKGIITLLDYKHHDNIY